MRLELPLSCGITIGGDILHLQAAVKVEEEGEHLEEQIEMEGGNEHSQGPGRIEDDGDHLPEPSELNDDERILQESLARLRGEAVTFYTLEEYCNSQSADLMMSLTDSTPDISTSETESHVSSNVISNTARPAKKPSHADGLLSIIKWQKNAEKISNFCRMQDNSPTDENLLDPSVILNELFGSTVIYSDERATSNNFSFTAKIENLETRAICASKKIAKKTAARLLLQEINKRYLNAEDSSSVLSDVSNIPSSSSGSTVQKQFGLCSGISNISIGLTPSNCQPSTSGQSTSACVPITVTNGVSSTMPNSEKINYIGKLNEYLHKKGQIMKDDIFQFQSANGKFFCRLIVLGKSVDSGAFIIKKDAKADAARLLLAELKVI